MSRIVIASTNPHKIGKLRTILEPHFKEVTSLLDLPGIVPAEETGATFAQNARLKALALSKDLHATVIATDGGASIPALGNAWNALYTRRFIGHNKTDEDRVRKMLEMMQGKADRRVWFTESYALCKDGKVLLEFEVTGPTGRIKESWDGRMEPGAWLLALWHLPGRNKDFLDLTPQEVAQEETTWTTLKEKTSAYFAGEVINNQT